MAFYEKNQHDKRHNVHKGMIMEGIGKMKAQQGEGGAGHSAAWTRDARRIMNGASNA